MCYVVGDTGKCHDDQHPYLSHNCLPIVAADGIMTLHSRIKKTLFCKINLGEHAAEFSDFCQALCHECLGMPTFYSKILHW
jgi:hypothetical protein